MISIKIILVIILLLEICKPASSSHAIKSLMSVLCKWDACRTKDLFLMYIFDILISNPCNSCRQNVAHFSIGVNYLNKKPLLLVKSRLRLDDMIPFWNRKKSKQIFISFAFYLRARYFETARAHFDRLAAAGRSETYVQDDVAEREPNSSP